MRATASLFCTYLIAAFLAVFVFGCSDEGGLVQETDTGTFIEQLRGVVETHVEPNRSGTYLFMGLVGSEIRRESVASGVIGDFDYVVAKDPETEKFSNFGFDVINDPERVYSLFGVLRGECSIPFDTPVNSPNGGAWAAYANCVIGLIESCGTVFSYVDGDRNWITNCMDPRGQIAQGELDLIEELAQLSSEHLVSSPENTVLLWKNVNPEHKQLATVTGVMKSGHEYAVIRGKSAAKLLEKSSSLVRLAAPTTCSIPVDTSTGSLLGQIAWANYINCSKRLHERGCGYTMTYVSGDGRLTTQCID